MISAWPKILILIDPQASQPFSTHHFPPLPGGEEVAISPSSQLSLETLLKTCVQVRSHALLKDVKDVLKGSPWEARGEMKVGVATRSCSSMYVCMFLKHLCVCLAELQMVPLCLRIKVPLKYGSHQVVLGVDPRIGHLVAAMDTPCMVGKVPACLEELEKAVTTSWSTLPAQLAKLQ